MMITRPEGLVILERATELTGLEMCEVTNPRGASSPYIGEPYHK